jgi:hypothetical protein
LQHAGHDVARIPAINLAIRQKKQVRRAIDQVQE